MGVKGEELRERVRERYAGAARSVQGGAKASCCGSAGERGLDSEALGVDWTGGGYSSEELRMLPQDAGAASLGCGNPTALATLSPGEVVLDLGSGGGIDVLLSAKRVSPGGKAYGLDMTDEMLELAEKNRVEAGTENVEFLKGEIEEIPLPEDHVDVVISNCVINLSADKTRVISEAFRVLKPGGRFAVSDMVFLGDKGKLPEEVVQSIESWAGCVSGALEKDEYKRLLSEAGFVDVSAEVTHTYDTGATTDSECCGGSGGCGETTTTSTVTIAEAPEVPLASAFIRGRKPAEWGGSMSTKEFGVMEENGVRREDGLDEGVERLVALGRALSDPIRVRMLSMMADGRGCCDFSDSGVPADEGEEGICVCEFEVVFSMGQSKVSYHMKKLKDAGLVREDRRGKWVFYSLDRETAGDLLGEAADRLLSRSEERVVAGGCC